MKHLQSAIAHKPSGMGFSQPSMECPSGMRSDRCEVESHVEASMSQVRNDASSGGRGNILPTLLE
jgi:hypothetical protein